MTIHSLILELTTIKSAIIKLDDWAGWNSPPENREYKQDLKITLEGCWAVMESLSEEVP